MEVYQARGTSNFAETMRFDRGGSRPQEIEHKPRLSDCGSGRGGGLPLHPQDLLVGERVPSRSKLSNMRIHLVSASQSTCVPLGDTRPPLVCGFESPLAAEAAGAVPAASAAQVPAVVATPGPSSVDDDDAGEPPTSPLTPSAVDGIVASQRHTLARAHTRRDETATTSDDRYSGGGASPRANCWRREGTAPLTSNTATASEETRHRTTRSWMK